MLTLSAYERRVPFPRSPETAMAPARTPSPPRRRWIDAPLGRWTLLGAGAAVAWAAQAQPIPYTSLNAGGAPSPLSIPYDQLGAPPASAGSPLLQALAAARRGDVATAQSLASTLGDPVARKLVLWAEIDAAGNKLSFAELDSAQRDLVGWPRASRRRAAAERAMETAATPPAQVVAWFAGREPDTAEGAMALAGAWQAQGRLDDAQRLIRHVWRDKSFEADVQARMLARYGAWLTPDDHARRVSVLLYGQQGPALRALLPVLSGDQAVLANARMALRADRPDAADLVAAVPPALQNDPGLTFDRARYYRKRGLDVMAVGLLKTLPSTPPTAEAAGAVWAERRALMQAALKAGDPQGAYQVAVAHGLSDGTDYTEAEFFAGWIALTKLKQPKLAEPHFANIERVGQTPVTLSRAYYWLGRTKEAQGDLAGARTEYRLGAAHVTAFYGQLSAERAGLTRITLPVEPQPTSDDRVAFNARETVKAAKLLGDAGQRDLFRTFVLAIDDDFATAGQFAQLVDLARAYGDQDLAMRVARAAGMKALPLTERGYPLRTAPAGGDLPEAAFTLAITRQESGFDPGVRSGAGARGLMQLMPATAAIVARKSGVSYSPSQLDDPDYNMRLGAAYLGQIAGQFGGSYVLAAAGYNAGPGRAAQWTTDCGDPRQTTIDPAEFLECIPFTETRNYVMRVMENLEVYRARLAGGSAPLTLTADLHRGGWTPSLPSATVASLPSADGALPPNATASR